MAITLYCPYCATALPDDGGCASDLHDQDGFFEHADLDPKDCLVNLGDLSENAFALLVGSGLRE